MNGKDFLKNLAILSAIPVGCSCLATMSVTDTKKIIRGVRPGDPVWLPETSWENCRLGMPMERHLRNFWMGKPSLVFGMKSL